MAEILYRTGTKDDVSTIIRLAKEETDQELSAGRVALDIEHHPNEIALERNNLIGFAVSEEVAPDILLVYALGIRQKYRCEKTGRQLLELIESKATNAGYYGIMVSGFVQRALLGCAGDEATFAGYKKIYDTGGSSLLLRCLR